MPFQAVSNLITGSLQAGLNWQSQHANLQYQKELQNKIFEREDSAVQRYTADLEKAGIDKLYAFGAGSGGVSNAGQAVQTTAPQIDLSGVSSALGVGSGLLGIMQGIQDLKNSEATEENIRSQTLNNIANSDLSKQQKDNLYQQYEENRNSIDWHWRNVSRPRDYQRGQAGQLAEDLVGATGAAISDTVRAIRNLFK